MSKSKLSKKEVTKLAVEAENILAALTEYKALYARLDEITNLLMDEDLSDTKFVVIDNFCDRNVVFRPAGVRRFELKLKKAA